MSNDTRLARRASEGDERAFAAIFRRYHQDLYRYCLAILRSPEDAQDALQNTMVAALRALPGERREIELKPWLYRIAHNESIDLVRRHRAGEPLGPELAAAGPGLSREAEARERLGKLLADLEQLPERQRGALLMRELGGLGFEQIGAALGCTPAVARQTTYEARLGLREFEAGREMECVAVTKALSDADGRVARRRDIRAHLRDCPACAAFQAEIKGRSRELAALSPLPAALAAGLLQGILGGGGGAAGGGGLAGALGAGAANSAVGSVALKATATVAVVAALGVGAERSRLIELPGGGGSGNPPARGSEDTTGAPAGAAAAAAPAAEDGDAPASRQAADRAASGRSPGTELATARELDKSPTRKATDPSQAADVPASDSQKQGDLPAASAHGQETAAASHERDRGRSGEHPTHPAHPAKPAHAGGPGKPEQKPAKEPKPAKGKSESPGNSAAAKAESSEPGPPPHAASAEAEMPAKGSGNGKKSAAATE